MATNTIPLKPKSSAKDYRKRIVLTQRAGELRQLVLPHSSSS